MVPLSFRRTDINVSELRWGDPIINSMLENKNIFPQFHGIASVETSNLAVLDLFFAFHLLYIIEYVDCTYKALLSHYKEHLEIFNSFMDVIGAERLDSIQKSHSLTVGDIVAAHLSLFKEFIDSKSFGENNSLIKNLFAFEYTVYQQAHAEKSFDKTLNFDFDVIAAKRTRCCSLESKPTTLRFLKDEERSAIIKVC